MTREFKVDIALAADVALFLEALLEAEFNESTNGIRQELNRFEQAGLLLAESDGNKKLYRANTLHPLFKDLNSIIRKFIGVE
jgi:hypothetical protein